MPDKFDKPRPMPGNSPATTRRRRYTPAPSPNLIVSLTPVKVQMMRFLAELRFLSLPQLARLCCPAERKDLSEKSARRHLRALFDAGLVDVLPVCRAALAQPDAGNDASLLHGSAPNVYSATREGLRLLVRAGRVGEDIIGRPAASYGPKNSLFLAHELLVRDVRVWLEECARFHGNGHTVLEWRDGNEAMISLGRARPPREARPDAWFVYLLCAAPKRVFVGLVEVDRGTERGDRRWKEKLEAYAALYSDGALQQTIGYINARALVICPDARRRDALADILAQEGGALASRFWLADCNVLGNSDLLAPLWRRQDSSVLLSLIPKPHP